MKAVVIIDSAISIKNADSGRENQVQSKQMQSNL